MVYGCRVTTLANSGYLQCYRTPAYYTIRESLRNEKSGLFFRECHTWLIWRSMILQWPPWTFFKHKKSHCSNKIIYGYQALDLSSTSEWPRRGDNPCSAWCQHIPSKRAAEVRCRFEFWLRFQFWLVLFIVFRQFVIFLSGKLEKSLFSKPKRFSAWFSYINAFIPDALCILANSIFVIENYS